MAGFAKLFGTGDQQQLVLLDSSDDGERIEVRLSAMPPDHGVCTVKHSWPATEAGREAARAYFERLDETQARADFRDALARIGVPMTPRPRPAGRPVLTVVSRTPGASTPTS